MDTILARLYVIESLIGRVTRGICMVLLAAIFAMFLANVFVRFVPVYNFTQTDDWIQLFLVWMIFLGSQELVRTRGHFVVDVLTDRIAGSAAGRALRVAVCVIELITYLIIFWYGCEWVLRSRAYMQSIPWLQMRWMYSAIPVSAFFMTLYAVRDLVLESIGKVNAYGGGALRRIEG